MPILKFSGLTQNQVSSYAENIIEISELIGAKPENIIFICENSSTLPIVDDKAPIYVTVEWMSRPDKEQLLTDHLMKHFSDKASKMAVFFTDVNGKLFMNGNRLG